VGERVRERGLKNRPSLTLPFRKTLEGREYFSDFDFRDTLRFP